MLLKVQQFLIGLIEADIQFSSHNVLQKLIRNNAIDKRFRVKAS